MDTRDVLVDGARLAYTDDGHGDAVVLVHGTPSYSYIWRNIVPPLLAAGHRVITYDLLGYGASERPVARDTSVTAQAALLPGLLDALGVDRCTLVGHDIGGAVAQIVALRYPARVARLMLIDTVSYDSWPSATWRAIIDRHLDAYAAMPEAAFLDMLRRQLDMTVTVPDGMPEDVMSAYLTPHRGPLGRASFFEHQVRHYDSTHTERLTPLLGGIAAPTRILWGAEDRWQPLAYGRRLAADIPGAELRVVPGAGHFLPEDAPARVAAEITELCGERPAQSASR